MINATKARSVYLKKAKKAVAKTIRKSVKGGGAFANLSFYENTFKAIAPVIKQWLESMGYSVELNNNELTMLVSWV